jgi:hypothetical protein
MEQVTPVLVRMPSSLKETVEQAATAGGRSTTAEIINRLQTSFAEDDDVHRLGLAVATMMQVAGVRAAELVPGTPRWLDDGWSFQQAAEAAMYLLDALRPGKVVPPKIEVSPEIKEQFGEAGEAGARLFAEATQRRLGVNVAGYLLAQSGGSLYEQSKEFQRILGPLAERITRKDK